MDIIRVLGVGIIGVICANLVKRDKPDFYLFIVTATGIIILLLILNSITEAITVFSSLIDESGIDSKLFSGILKIIGIGYLTEFSASLCTDYGVSSVANKLQLAGKVTIFLMAVPLITKLVEIIKLMI